MGWLGSFYYVEFSLLVLFSSFCFASDRIELGPLSFPEESEETAEIENQKKAVLEFFRENGVQLKERDSLDIFFKDFLSQFRPIGADSFQKEDLKRYREFFQDPGAMVKLNGMHLFAYRQIRNYVKSQSNRFYNNQILLDTRKRLQIDQERERFRMGLGQAFNTDYFADSFPSYWDESPDKGEEPRPVHYGEKITLIKIQDFSVDNAFLVRYRGDYFFGLILQLIPDNNTISDLLDDWRGNPGINATPVENDNDPKDTRERTFQYSTDLKIGAGVSRSNLNPIRKITWQNRSDIFFNNYRFLQFVLNLEYRPAAIGTDRDHEIVLFLGIELLTY